MNDNDNDNNHTESTEIIDLMNIDYNQVCRGCLSKDDDLKSVYATLEDMDENIILSDMFMECTSIQINDNDNLPKQFCDNCIYQINHSYLFKKQCQRVDESLRYFNEQKSKLIINKYVDENNDDLSTITNNDVDDDKFKLETDEYMIDNDINNIDVIEEDLKTSKRKYKCTTCSKMFLTSSHLHTHQLIHTNEKPYVCTVCNKGFNTKPNLKRHNMIHTGERPYKCDICSKSFIQQVTLNDHKRIHTNETPYICKICDNNNNSNISKAFKQSAELRRHIKKYHQQNQNHNNININSKKKINKKLKKLHVENNQQTILQHKSYLCCNCGKSFTSNTLLDIHMRIHTGEKPYKCLECDKSFSQISTLKTHKLIHTTIKEYECPYCKKLFRHRIALKQHILIHEGIKKYICTYCNKHFTQSSQLNYHLRTHTGEKPYQCCICFKTFALKGNLTVHERIHTGVTPYLCNICLKGFYDSSSLKKHLKFKHNDHHNKKE